MYKKHVLLEGTMEVAINLYESHASDHTAWGGVCYYLIVWQQWLLFAPTIILGKPIKS